MAGEARRRGQRDLPSPPSAASLWRSQSSMPNVSCMAAAQQARTSDVPQPAPIPHRTPFEPAPSERATRTLKQHEPFAI